MKNKDINLGMLNLTHQANHIYVALGFYISYHEMTHKHGKYTEHAHKLIQQVAQGGMYHVNHSDIRCLINCMMFYCKQETIGLNDFKANHDYIHVRRGKISINNMLNLAKHLFPSFIESLPPKKAKLLRKARKHHIHIDNILSL